MQVTEAVRVTSTSENLRLSIWDLGPSKPEAPEKPPVPKEKEGTPEHKLATLDFNEELAAYETAFLSYRAAKREYDAWQKSGGGAVGIEMWSVDAAEAIERDPNRFVWTLPRNVKPGPVHERNLERARDRQSEASEQARRDPQFGTGAQK